MTLRKIATACAAALVVALAACGGEATPTQSSQQPIADATFAEGTTMAALQRKGKIVIGTKFDQPLFGLLGPDGTPEGFDVEVGKIIARHLGLDPDAGGVEWVETVSANREPFIQNAQVDIVIATYTVNDARKEVIDFAGPYYMAGQSLLVAAGNPEGVSGPDGLGEHTVCTVTGSTSEKNIREYTDKVLTVDRYSDCLEPIRNGQAVALTTDNVILAGLVAQNEGEFELAGEQFTQEPYGIGLKKGDDEFRAFINDALEQSYEDGTWRSAWERTAGQVLEVPEPPAVERY